MTKSYHVDDMLIGAGGRHAVAGRVARRRDVPVPLGKLEVMSRASTPPNEHIGLI